jgi:uncharacterized protein (TIGR00162 family)
MELFRFIERSKPRLAKPAFVEGLPGVGNVGKLAAQQVVDTLGATLWCDIVGRDFPPQVTIQDDGTVRLVRCQLWYAKGNAKRSDLIILTGDYQPLSSPGQHELVDGVLDRIEQQGCTALYTLGGYATGSRVVEPQVLGAATDTKTVTELRRHGVRVPPGEEEEGLGGGIIGASGLFLGLGQLRGMKGACLMGETNGYMVDPKAARAVLQTLGKLVGGTFDTADLEEKARIIEAVAQQLQEADAKREAPGDLHYIG